jgi:hypothetical protein
MWIDPVVWQVGDPGFGDRRLTLRIFPENRRRTGQKINVTPPHTRPKIAQRQYPIRSTEGLIRREDVAAGDLRAI